MKNKMPKPAELLLNLISCFANVNGATTRSLTQLFSEMDARSQQVYVTNLKKLLAEYPLFNMRTNEKAYTQVMLILNDLLKESVYKARKGQ